MSIINRLFKNKKGKYEIIARAIINHNNQVLLCRNKKDDRYYFPGGHVEIKEKAENTLHRELKEELGLIINNISFIGAVEQVYKKKNNIYHEVNLVFEVDVEKIKTKSLEDHIDFKLVSVENLDLDNLLPKALRRKIIRWLKNKEVFWKSDVSSKIKK